MTDELAQQILDAMNDLRDEQVALRQLLEGQHQQPLSRADRAAFGRILPAIAGAIGSEWFACRDLEEEDSAALRLVLTGLSTKSIGRLFRRGMGCPVDGYLIERRDRELGVWLWRVMSCG